MPTDRITNELKAIDSDGERYLIIERTEFYDTGTFGEPGTEEQGLKYYELVTGEKCNRMSESEYQIVSTGKLIRVYST